MNPKIAHTFEIESDLMDDLNFNFDICEKNVKKSSDIIIVKKQPKRKKDGSTGRLF